MDAVPFDSWYDGTAAGPRLHGWNDQATPKAGLDSEKPMNNYSIKQVID